MYHEFDEQESNPLTTVNNFWSMLGGTVVDAIQTLDGSDVKAKPLTPIENFKKFLVDFLELLTLFTSERHFESTWVYNDYVEEFRCFHLTLDVIADSMKDSHTELRVDSKVDTGSDLARYHPDVFSIVDKSLSKYSGIKKSESRILGEEVVEQIELLLGHSTSTAEALKDLPPIRVFNSNYFTQDGSPPQNVTFGRAECLVHSGAVRGYPASQLSLFSRTASSSGIRGNNRAAAATLDGDSLLLLQEARLLQLHQLPGVLRLYGVDHSEWPSRVLTEAYRCSLETLLHDEKVRGAVCEEWTVSRRLGMMAECANTFAFLHSIKVVHGDIQPRNILVLRDGRVKVAHFSLKTERDIRPDCLYTAPELITGRGGAGGGGLWGTSQSACFSEASDVFSFAVTLNEVLTGQRPSGRPPALLLYTSSDSDGGGECSSASSTSSSEDLRVMLDDCLSDDPAQRGTFSQCSVDLHHILTGDKDCNHSNSNAADAASPALLSAMRPPNGQFRTVSNVFIASDLFTGYYSGSLMGDVRHGKGCMQCLDGSSYDGEWDRNTRHGQGKALELGDVYVGTFVNDLMEGHGVMSYSDGSVYEGDWSSSAMEGNGSMTYADGSVYVGEWKNNYMEGLGSMSYAARDFYEGQWRQNKMEGQGMMKYANGSVYVGDWRNGAMEGYGVMRYFSKDLYEGGWWFDQKEGRGIMRWYNGDVYEGDWKSNAMDGQGTMRCANGDVYEGEWMDSAMEGFGVMKYANGDVYTGHWILEQREGQGTMVFANGDEYEGDWKAGRMHGCGVMKYANGEVYEGQWIEGSAGYGNHYKIGESRRGSSILMGLDSPSSPAPGRQSISTAAPPPPAASPSAAAPSKWSLSRLFSSVTSSTAPPAPPPASDSVSAPPSQPSTAASPPVVASPPSPSSSSQRRSSSDSGGSTDCVEESSVSDKGNDSLSSPSKAALLPPADKMEEGGAVEEQADTS